MSRFKPIQERFWANVRKSDGCWEWTACIGTGGYGKIYWDGKNHTASRVAYRLTYGEIDPAICVLHRCDNRKCVRPDHLFLGTLGDNMRDKARKERSGLQKIPKAVHKEICAWYLVDGITQKEIASRLGLSQGRISKIIALAPELKSTKY